MSQKKAHARRRRHQPIIGRQVAGVGYYAKPPSSDFESYPSSLIRHFEHNKKYVATHSLATRSDTGDRPVVRMVREVQGAAPQESRLRKFGRFMLDTLTGREDRKRIIAAVALLGVSVAVIGFEIGPDKTEHQAGQGPRVTVSAPGITASHGEGQVQEVVLPPAHPGKPVAPVHKVIPPRHHVARTVTMHLGENPWTVSIQELHRQGIAAPTETQINTYDHALLSANHISLADANHLPPQDFQLPTPL
jgi:hypothetical protein